MASKGNSVENGQSGNVIKQTPFQMMIRAMANDASADDGAFSGDDLNALLDAETEEELWDADERPPLNFQHLTGCELSIIDLQVKFSRGGKDGILTPFVYDDGKNSKKMYLLCTMARIGGGDNPIIKLPPIGEVFQANTSARYVVAKLWRFMTMGHIDPNTGKTLECMVQATDLGDGASVIKLRPLPTRVTRTVTE